MSRSLAAFILTVISATLLAGLFYLVTPLQEASAQTATDFAASSKIKSEQGTKIVTLSNSIVSRTIRLGQTGPVTTSLLNNLTHSEYLKATKTEFSVQLSHELEGKDETYELKAENFRVVNFSLPVQTSDQQILEVDLSGIFGITPVNVFLFYEVSKDSNYTRKWLKIAPFYAPNWVIREVTLEDWQTAGTWQPLSQVQRYPELHSNGSDQINYSTGRDLTQVSNKNPEQRFTSANYSRQAAVYPDHNQGIYFFTESLFGSEYFDGNLTLGNADFIEPHNGFTSGRAVTGVWVGSPELGFKRYNEYVYNHYAAVKGKKDPTWFNSWYVYEDKINADNILATIDGMQAAGFYDLMHIDAGWEKDAPLNVNTDSDKFPDGLDPIITKLNSSGLGLGLWMNPFSSHYEEYTSYRPFRGQHPDWVAGNGAWICPLSGAGQYVRSRLLEIASEWPLQELYWDGADWNISGCDSQDRNWRTPAEEHILTIKFFARLVEELHKIRPNLRVIVWSAPPDIHWLAAVDQMQLSDIDDQPLGTSELIRRQQIYHASFLKPSAAIWGDWYGIQYRRNDNEPANKPAYLLQYAEVSQLGNGATQAGGGYAVSNAPAEWNAFVGKMFAFRKQFETYFESYQHVLGFPDGINVDGEAHIVEGKGFILLYNPSEADQMIRLPLNEPELELSPNKIYHLTDWSEMDSSFEIWDVHTNEVVPVTVPAHGWRFIGVDMPVQTLAVK